MSVFTPELGRAGGTLIFKDGEWAPDEGDVRGFFVFFQIIFFSANS